MLVNRGIGRYAPVALWIACLLGVAACRTTVPEPTMPVGDSSKPVPDYSMHNIGPQRVQKSFAARFTDLNQDGRVDLLVGGRKPASGYRVEWGDGKGHWRTQAGPGTSMEPRTFAVADLEGDGSLEELIGGQGDQKGLQIWKVDAGGEWRLQSAPTESGEFRDAALADINEDGWPDVIAVRVDSEAEGGIYVWLNNGRGGWVADIGPMVEGIFTDMAVADINADGHVDIVASRRSGFGAQRLSDGHWRQVGSVQIWYGDGSARWEPRFLPAEGDVESVTVADVNGDGRPDIAAGLYQQGIDLWLGSQNGWDKQRVINEGTWGTLRVGDLDGDGRRELVAASRDGRGLGLWQWSGGVLSGGEFNALTGWLPDRGVYADVDLGDVYGKGLLDVAAVRADGAVEVWSGSRPRPLPARRFVGRPVGEALSMYFDTASAHVEADNSQALDAWLTGLGEGPKGMYFRIRGRADVRPVHTEVFPNNEALSKARAESVAAILRGQGIPDGQITIEALGDKDPLPPGLGEAALRQNRRVLVQAYPLRSVRIPSTAGKPNHGDLFHVNENKTFKILDGIPEYRVGSGDELSITLWQGGGKSEEYKVVVQVNGTVSLPFFEAVHVEGMTPREIDAFMTQSQKRFVRHPRVDVRVLKARSKTTTIFGQVQSLLRQPTGPGTYFLKGKESLVEFLSRAGGPAKDADLTKVQIIRNGKTILLNLDRAIKQADWRENAIIDDGDTIFIPSLAQSKRRIYVLGQVKKPGIVEFSGNIRFLDAISKGGGFGDHPYYPDIRVIRADRDRPLILAVNFERLLEQGDLTQNLALRDKDVIIIPRSPIGNWNQYIKDITPSLDLLLFKPLTAVDEVQTIRTLTRSLNSTSGTTIVAP